MINPHPPLSSFPFSIIILLLISELLSSRKNLNLDFVKDFLISMLLIFSILTFISGYFSVDYNGQNLPLDLIERHQTFAKLILISVIPMVILKYLSKINLKFKNYYYFFLIITAFLIVTTSYYGGNLVFEHGVGVSKMN